MSGVFSERWLTCSGIRTRCLEAGEKNHRSIVFIHGLGSSADRWLDVPLAMSLYYHTLTIDLPGFGMADKPQAGFTYSVAEYADYVSQLIQKLGLHRTTLVGHSLGGYIAAEVALRHRSLVDRLVLIDTSGMLEGPTDLLKHYLEAAMNPTRESVRAVLEKLVAHPSRIFDILVDGFIYRMGLPGAKHAFKLAYENSVKTQIGIDRLRELTGIPTLVVWGKEDRLIPPGYQLVFQQAIKGSVAELVGDAGHAPFAEKPALTSEIIHRFLESTD